MIKKGYIDTFNFYIQESYIGYGRKTDLNKMGLLELKEELKMADKQVKLCKEEIDSSDDGVPSFALKEKLLFSPSFRITPLSKPPTHIF